MKQLRVMKLVYDRTLSALSVSFVLSFSCFFPSCNRTDFECCCFFRLNIVKY